MKKILILYIFVQIFASSAFGYTYEKRTVDSHVLHIVTLKADDYTTAIIKASKGRETVPSMAKRSNAIVAINGGFFEIGDKNDGMPSRTLVINGKSFKLLKGKQPLLILNNGRASIDFRTPDPKMSKDMSLLAGIPLLIHQGQINKDILKGTSAFYIKPHARTAIGTDSNGHIILLVAEQFYQANLNAVTMGEVQSLMTRNGKDYAQKYHKNSPGDLTLTELKDILKDEYHPQNTKMRGLTISELAKTMKDLGCQEAINLDGGGSSTLWIENKVINQTIGDADEANGQQIVRPVSDAIVFIKKEQ